MMDEKEGLYTQEREQTAAPPDGARELQQGEKATARAAAAMAAGAPNDFVGQGKSYQQAPFSYDGGTAEAPVLSNGTMRHTVTDFVLPGRNGFDFAISRTYDSDNAGLAYMSVDWYTNNGGRYVEVTTKARANAQYLRAYGLGYGWSFNLPFMEVLADWSLIGGGRVRSERLYLHLEDGRNICFENQNADEWRVKDYHMNDVTLRRETGTLTHPQDPNETQGYHFVVTYKDGSKDYFSRHTFGDDWHGWTHRFTLQARQDRFGNTIIYRLGYIGGMTVIDSWGRAIQLVKDGNTMTWHLPDGKTIQYVIDGYLVGDNAEEVPLTSWLSFNIHGHDPMRLASVRDQEGRVTRYEYYPYLDYVANCRFNQAAEQFPYVLMKKITHPTGATTEYEYGRGGAANMLQVNLNDQGGYRQFFPFLGRRDVAEGGVYNTVGYSYSLSGDGKYIGTAEETRLNGVVNRHTFNDKGQLTRKETHHSGALVFDGSYTYGTDQNAANYRLLVSEAEKTYDASTTASVLEKNTSKEYTGDKKADIAKITESYPQNPALDQETTFAYGAYSQLTQRTCKKDDGTFLMERNTLRASPDDKVVEVRRVYESAGGAETLKEKTRYLYGTGADDSYCVTQEQRFTAIGAADLESSGQCVNTFYTYSAAKYTHQPVSVRTSGLVDANGAAVADVMQRFDYDAVGRQISVTDGLGHTTNTTYDGLGRVLAEVYPAVDGVRHSVTNVYNDAQNTITQTDENGHRTRTCYTPLGSPLKRELAVASTPAAGDILLDDCAYDASQRLIQERVFDGSGGTRTTTRYAYDSFDRVVTKEIGEVGYREDHAYLNVAEGKYSRHQVTVNGDSIAPATVSATYQDQLGQTVKEVLDGVVTAQYTYNRLGHKTAQTDAAGNTVTFGVDYAGRTLATTRRMGGQAQTARAAYDALGNKTSSTDYAGHTTTYVYDALGRLLRQTAPFDVSNAVTQYTYDAAGNMTGQQVQYQRPGAAVVWRHTRYDYDARGRQSAVYLYEDDARQRWSGTRYLYDGKGNKLEMRTGFTHATSDYNRVRYTYSRFGNVLTVTDALGQMERYTYDNTGRLLTKTDRNGSVTRYSHDKLGRLLREEVTATDERGSVTSAREFTYSVSGQKASEKATETRDGQKQVLSTQFRYNARKQLVTQQDPDGIEKRFTYDSRGNRASFVMLRGGATEISLFYEYDEAGRLVRVRRGSASGSLLAEYTYDANGNRTRLLCPDNGVETTYAYNRANLVTSLMNRRGGAVLSQFGYSYYLDGNQAVKTTPDSTVRYAYDRLGRLTEENDSKWSRITYEYDRFQNRARMAVTPHGQQVDKPYETAYVYDKNNRLLRETKTDEADTETWHYKYDACGNQLYREWEGTGPRPQEGRSGFGFICESKEDGTAVVDMRQYNGFGQLIRVWRDTLEVQYAYRPDNLRHAKRVKKLLHATETEAVFHWDGQNMVMEANGANGSVKARYLRGTGLLAQQIDGGLFTYTHNAHGDVVQRVGANGAAAPAYEYDAFGNQREPGQTDPNPFRYCGEFWDGELGEVYLRARTYDPRTGRFSRQDPAKDGQNWYNYCSSNPVNRIDPTGLYSYADWLKTRTKEQIASENAAKKAAYAWAAAQTKATALSHNSNASQHAQQQWNAAQNNADWQKALFMQNYPASPITQYFDWQMKNSYLKTHDPLRGYGNWSRDWGTPDGYTGTHRGIDIRTGGVEGIGLYSIWYGEVMISEFNENTYGNYLKVRLIDGEGNPILHNGKQVYILLGHMAELSIYGNTQTISPGDLLGEVGTTGPSSGIHLHIEAMTDDGLIDPWTYLYPGIMRPEVTPSFGDPMPPMIYQ